MSQGGVTDRVRRLREQTLAGRPSISAERAELVTRFYRGYARNLSPVLLRANCFARLCAQKTIYIGAEELIVGERGPAPKATPTYPELTCHSLEDLRVLNDRAKTSYEVGPDVLAVYEREIIPFWHGRSLREQIFAALPAEWHAAYEAGIFTEFMEQRAPGHTVADGRIYRQGLEDLKREIAAARAGLDGSTAANSAAQRDQLDAMEIVADAVILYAQRHAEEARSRAESEKDPRRRAELEQIARICARVPGQAPRTFWEALQAYWFCHLAVVTELNGWDAFSPGHLDQHLAPFYAQGLADGSLTRDRAKELLECFFIKFNNHPAPPKVGVTAAESGTYTDFANINLAGQTREGGDGTSEVSYLLLEVIEELHILQPSTNVQISRHTPHRFLLEACRVIRQGHGFPSVFNSDAVVAELRRQGKTAEDAREGGTSGCVESGAFGKEAYILTGYLNLPKLLELALRDGFDPRLGRQLGPRSGAASTLGSFDRLVEAWEKQLQHFIEVKLRGNRVIERLYAEQMPAPFLSLITADCIARGRDYNAGGARYNTSYIQGVGIGTLTDGLAAIQEQVFQRGTLTLGELVSALDQDFALAARCGEVPPREGEGSAPDRGRFVPTGERLRLLLRNRAPKWGNDDEVADALMQSAFDAFFRSVDGRPNERGGQYHINMLPTTCHIYFGSVTGATPDGRRAGRPLSEGISPVQGRDRRGPTAVILSAARMDHIRTGGTLLNMKFSPQVLAGETGLEKLADLIRTYFELGGHHIQFNVVAADTLRAARDDPEAHRNLIVRVAGYSDYFCDLSRALQDEIITRTEQSGF